MAQENGQSSQAHSVPISKTKSPLYQTFVTDTVLTETPAVKTEQSISSRQRQPVPAEETCIHIRQFI